MLKLLMLGSNVHSDLLVKIAKDGGIYTVVTDDRSVEESPVKLVADEYWDISVLDLDTLEAKCRSEGITAVLCGSSELCLDSVRELCKRLNLPFWIGDEAWKYTNDKAEFKKICRECGLPVAKDYKLDRSFSKEDLANIEYPVVVKPVDGCSSVGMHICMNEEELIAGYNDAYDHSSARKVVVEKCIMGLEVSLIYFFKDGVPQFFTAFDSYGDRIHGHPLVFGANPTCCHRDLRQEWQEPLEKLFKRLKCREGVGFIQTLVDEQEAVVMEMNYRLPGGHFTDEWVMLKHYLEYSLNGKLVLDNAKYQISLNKPQSFIYFIWLKPGIVGKIDGVEMIRENIPIVAMTDMKPIGANVVENTGMKQIFSGIVFLSDLDNAAEKVSYINDHLKVYDINGNDMVCRYEFKPI